MIAPLTRALLLAARLAFASAYHPATLSPDDCADASGTFVYPTNAPAQCVLTGEDIEGADIET